jgi:hypothetical protein
MELNNFTDNQSLIRKFYSLRAITIATYLGGPVAAGYLARQNFIRLGKENYGGYSLIIGILSTLFIIIGLFSIPEPIMNKIPNAVIPLFYTAIIYLLIEKLQGRELKEHKDSNGAFYSGWKAAGIGAVCLVFLLVFIAMAAFFAGDLSKTKADFDASAYDKEMAKFIENEKEALKVFNVIETSKPDYLIKEFGRDIVLWQENKEIVCRLNTIENLPQKLLDQNIKLIKYCDLRIQHHKILIKAISEQTDKYVSEIAKVGSAINQILKELKEK